jgi:hypothetical protein
MNRAVAPPPQRQDKPQHVNIVTIGLHLIDRWFELHMLQPSRAARSIMSRYSGFQDDRTLHVLIHEMLQFLEIPSSPAYMTSVDCRQFHDPDRCRGINHVGYNAEIIERIVNHGTFEGFIQRQCKFFITMLQNWHHGEPSPTIVFICNKGRHRSVAVGHIFRHIAKASGWVPRTMNLMQDCQGVCEAPAASQGFRWHLCVNNLSKSHCEIGRRRLASIFGVVMWSEATSCVGRDVRHVLLLLLVPRAFLKGSPLGTTGSRNYTRIAHGRHLNRS